MKKIIYSLMTCVFLTLGLQAQSSDSNQLQLTESQQEQFLLIENQRKQAMMSIEPLLKKNSDSYHSRRAQIMNEADLKVKALLNKEQWGVYERIIKQRNDLYRKLK